MNTQSRALLTLSLFSFVIASAMGLLAGQAVAEQPAIAKQPNIVWLVSEDNSKHYLKLFDENGVETPNIAALAQHGLKFNHAFSNSPVCSVARTTLATGCYGPRIGTHYHRRSKLVPMPNGLKMFSAYLRDAGYYATNHLKKDYNVIEEEGVWDKSGKFDWQGRAEGQPFFHFQTFKQSHEGSLHFPLAHVKNKPTKTDVNSVFVAPYHPNTEVFRYTNARYRDNIQTIDAKLGEVVEKLTADGELENTFIFYFGDHGGVLPRGKGYAYESGLHVPLVVRIPENFKDLVDEELAAAVGGEVDGFVSFIDFAPTMLNLAGVKVPAEMDGQPFLGPGVSMKELNQRDEAFGYADRFDEKYDLVRTLRKGKWKYIRNFEPFYFDGLQNNYRYKASAFREWRELFEAGKLNEAQSQFFQPRQPEGLYDLSSDPHEIKNLAADPAHAEQLTKMRKRMHEYLVEKNDLSLYPESHLVEHALDNPTKFGTDHATEISNLVDLTALQLGSFDSVRAEIKTACESESEMARYWGFTACCAHGKDAAAIAELAKQVAANDTNRLVRARAALFLGLTGLGDPIPTFESVMTETKAPVEALEILNMIVLLRDGDANIDCKFDVADLQTEVRSDSQCIRRLHYLYPKIVTRAK